MEKLLRRKLKRLNNENHFIVEYKTCQMQIAHEKRGSRATSLKACKRSMKKMFYADKKIKYLSVKNKKLK